MEYLWFSFSKNIYEGQTKKGFIGPEEEERVAMVSKEKVRLMSLNSWVYTFMIVAQVSPDINMIYEVKFSAKIANVRKFTFGFQIMFEWGL